jgi:hypothetical protein
VDGQSFPVGFSEDRRIRPGCFLLAWIGFKLNSNGAFRVNQEGGDDGFTLAA